MNIVDHIKANRIKNHKKNFFLMIYLSFFNRTRNKINNNEHSQVLFYLY